jgi:hypothetical protein
MRRITILLSVAILTLGLTACAGFEPASTPSVEEQSPAAVEAVPTLDDHDLNMASAEIAWMTMSVSDRAMICEFYLTPPVGLTSELVEAFAGPAGLSYDEAADVLSELLAGEC